MKKNTKVVAVNCKNSAGFNVYLDFSGQREFVAYHRHNGFLYQLLKDGVYINELKRSRPHRIVTKYGGPIYGTASVRAESQLCHLIRVIDIYLAEIEDAKNEAA